MPGNMANNSQQQTLPQTLHNSFFFSFRLFLEFLCGTWSVVMGKDLFFHDYEIVDVFIMRKLPKQIKNRVGRFSFP